MSRSGIMLCYPFEEKRLNKWKQSSVIVQPKLDGERCRAVFDANGIVTLYSSEENIIISVPHINSQLESTGLKDIELDGELYTHGDSFEHIHSIVSRRVNQHFDHERINYHVFDVVNDQMQTARLITLYRVLSSYNFESVKLVGNAYANSLKDIMLELQEFKKKGYEGIIVRHPLAPYVRKRSTYVMKFKPKKQDIYKIIGYKEEVSIHGTPKNRLGALILQGDDGTEFSVGSGFNDEDREFFWRHREMLIGEWCVVEYQHITSTGRVPRFPIFLSIRKDIL